MCNYLKALNIKPSIFQKTNFLGGFLFEFFISLHRTNLISIRHECIWCKFSHFNLIYVDLTITLNKFLRMSYSLTILIIISDLKYNIWSHCLFLQRLLTLTVVCCLCSPIRPEIKRADCEPKNHLSRTVK